MADIELVIKIDEDTYKDIKRGKIYTSIRDVPQEYVVAIANGTPLPKDATNGDVIEKIFGKDVYCTLIRMMYSSCCEKLKKWWDAPYQKGGEE